MKNKLVSLILSLLIAFGLWGYVITVDNPDFKDTIYGIPVVFTGETALNEKGLILAVEPNATVDLTLSGSRSDVVKCDKSNITVKVDLSKIYDEGIHNLEYSYSFPADVPSNAFSVENKYPGTIAVSVAKWSRKEVPVTVVCQGTVSEGFIADTENVVKDYSMVAIQGPAAVVEQIQEALINVDVTDQKESISQNFRYTLCNAEGEPVDAQQITTNVEEVQLTAQIQQIQEVDLIADVVYGGGATPANTTVSISPEVIRVSGGKAVLEELGDTYTVGSIVLADIEKSSHEQTFPLSLPEGVTNQTGVSEVTVTVRFRGLKTKEFVVDKIEMTNVPEGMTAEIINANLTVRVRGPEEELSQLTEKDITAVVDLSAAEAGTATYKATIVFNEKFPNVGAMKTSSVSATVQPKEE